MFSSFAYFVDKYLNRNGVLTTFGIYTCRLVRRLPKGISAREVLMRKLLCYNASYLCLVLVFSFQLRANKEVAIPLFVFALISNHSYAMV